MRDTVIAYFVILFFSFIISFLVSYFIIPRLKRYGITGIDVNKPNKPKIAEMGGFSIVAGFTAGVLLSVFLIHSSIFILILFLYLHH